MFVEPCDLNSDLNNFKFPKLKRIENGILAGTEKYTSVKIVWILDLKYTCWSHSVQVFYKTISSLLLGIKERLLFNIKWHHRALRTEKPVMLCETSEKYLNEEAAV